MKNQDRFSKWLSEWIKYYDSKYWEEMDRNIINQNFEDIDSYKLFKLIKELENEKSRN